MNELTERQREVLRLLAQGLLSKEIGRRLGISNSTVKNHLTDIYRVLGARNRVEATVTAIKRELV